MIKVDIFSISEFICIFFLMKIFWYTLKLIQDGKIFFFYTFSIAFSVHLEFYNCIPVFKWKYIYWFLLKVYIHIVSVPNFFSFLVVIFIKYKLLETSVELEADLRLNVAVYYLLLCVVAFRGKSLNVFFFNFTNPTETSNSLMIHQLSVIFCSVHKRKT